MTLHLRSICPECGDPVETAGSLCDLCINAEDEFCDEDELEYYEDDGEIEDHVANSHGDVA